ncbi:putative meiosis-specific topoisomerase Spo11 [Aspergillus homomorphus CBS 101889]|uniref:DNA topoisomerase (ATP-hydrolyzing) n=1 Tax=Aspergillus homomorphus (strain CBS 101889) TaxID=1450537 RepID=A0A395HGC2_ASPHC|nr:meiotic recombination protein spo11 [Aspergillus homomorphus CBS 101889]RAL06981.1 meiotic recombination protein spo11 [Aspergillus homomorphus CBS 101889]
MPLTPDASHAPSPPQPPSTLDEESSPQTRVKEHIASALSTILTELSSPDGHPSLTIKLRSNKVSARFISPRTGALETQVSDTYTTYTWPGKDYYEAWKFTVAMRVLSGIADAVDKGVVVSKRDIYYQDPAIFGSQRVVDRLVDDFAHTIGVDRVALNVGAAAKGLVVGCFHWRIKDQAMADDAHFLNADTLIPSPQDIQEMNVSDVDWVLILEKEAVYRRLAGMKYHVRSTAGLGILVTGKGYPDLKTRAFIRRLYDASRQPNKRLRFYALVDGDPDGMAIMSTYKYGSLAYAHENSTLNCSDIRWLGLRTSDIVTGVDRSGNDALVSLTDRDRKKILAMLSNNPVWAVDGPEQEGRAELLQMLMLNVKAEMQILYDGDGGLVQWLDRRMTHIS